MAKRISKELRRQVYEKYDGHCAYCGCNITPEEMQVDHIESQYRAGRRGEEADNSIGNLMPACRMCNYYKGTRTVEQFRGTLKGTLLQNLKSMFNWRLAKKYRLVEYGPAYFDRLTFYFELVDERERKERQREECLRVLKESEE